MRFEALHAANHVLHVEQGAESRQHRETSGRRSSWRPKQRTHNQCTADVVPGGDTDWVSHNLLELAVTSKGNGVCET